jgi:FkbH-like protein
LYLIIELTLKFNMKLALLGNYATQFLSKPLSKKLKTEDASFQLYHAEFNTIDLEFIDADSGLFQYVPDFIVWHESTLSLRDLFYQTSLERRETFAVNYIQRIGNYLDTVKNQLPKCKVIFPNHSLIFNDNVFGNFSSKVTSSWKYQVDKINFLLNELSSIKGNFYLVESKPNQTIEPITDYSMVVNAELHFTPDYLNWLSNSIVEIIHVFQGKFKKCVILDLDNTLWGGIIGDDGLENIQIGILGIGKAFTRFQKWLKELKNRGVILAVCSKNEENIAKMPFLQHPEMVLKLEDIAVFVANWNSKADNINQIQQILNIGFDSMVFIDDNPAEREIVRTYLPLVCVPELPVDPSNYLSFLISENLFETVSYSDNDLERTKQYQEEAKRVELSKSITNMDDYLESLEMTAKIGPFRELDVERIAQLTQRSNQFNLKTIRYTNVEIERIMADSNVLTVSVEVADKFGNYGLIGVVIIEITGTSANIDTWIMSCRVLKRTVEHTVMNYVVDSLLKLSIQTLNGQYIPTEKNKLVLNLLRDLGMSETKTHDYALNLLKFEKLKSFIKIL